MLSLFGDQIFSGSALILLDRKVAKMALLTLKVADYVGNLYICMICNDSNDKIALLAVESRHLQILLIDEYETKIQNVTFTHTCVQHIHVLPNKKTALLEFITLFDVSMSIGTVEHKPDIKY